MEMDDQIHDRSNMHLDVRTDGSRGTPTKQHSPGAMVEARKNEQQQPKKKTGCSIFNIRRPAAAAGQYSIFAAARGSIFNIPICRIRPRMDQLKRLQKTRQGADRHRGLDRTAAPPAAALGRSAWHACHRHARVCPRRGCHRSNFHRGVHRARRWARQ